MSNQTKNSNVNYLIDPTFTKLKRLFVWSKDFNILIDAKFFLHSHKNLEESHEKIEMSRNNDHTTAILLDYESLYWSITN